MALEVEDGTGKANAESFVSVAEASAYHSARGNAAWAALASDEVREQCLRRATDYMQQMYRTRWAGWRKSAAQALEWPRDGVLRDNLYPYPTYYADNIVPTEVKNACAELALKAASAALAPDLDRAKASVTVGPLSVTYDPTSPEAKRYRAAEAMIIHLLSDSGNSVRLVRT
jgi:hypothetical protein